VPDLSFDASVGHDPYLMISGGSMYAGGGTSVSAPIFAGMVALANQQMVVNNGGSPGLGNLNPSLYAMAQPPSWGYSSSPSPFHDVTSGNNIVPCVAGTADCTDGSLGFTAGPGYDQVTGLGSLNALSFVGDFTSPPQRRCRFLPLKSWRVDSWC
jgi:subtilase family serine protease